MKGNAYWGGMDHCLKRKAKGARHTDSLSEKSGLRNKKTNDESPMTEDKKTFKITTLGCKVNQYESAYLRESLLQAGWSQVSKNERADTTIINTCIVTQRASYQSRQAIRKAARENPSGKVAAIGCYAQVYPQELLQIPGVHLIAGNTAKARVPDILLDRKETGPSYLVSEDFKSDAGFDFLPVKRFSDRTRAFLKIQDGCQSFCSYCIVPVARGPLKSLDPSRVIFMLKSLVAEGYKEGVLTGIHLGKYGIDLDQNMDLKRLLALIDRQALPLRIRLSSLEPNEIDTDLIEMMASVDWLCRHFHIPLQSGDNGILRRMNRDYTADEFAALIEYIHKRIPLAAIGVDTMAGFPGESDQAHRNTYAIIHDLPVSYLHVFPFSPRKGTPAAEFPGQVKQRTIKQRAAALRSLGQKKREAFYRSCLGEEFFALSERWESESERTVRGLTDNYLPVIFSSRHLVKNSLVLVRLEELGKNGVLGRAVSEP
jgi:threonylcarbamoyladenosine tRNA methylthiotransferase MtaB